MLLCLWLIVSMSVGGAVNLDSSEFIDENSTFSENVAATDGGAISLDGESSFTATGTHLLRNTGNVCRILSCNGFVWRSLFSSFLSLSLSLSLITQEKFFRSSLLLSVSICVAQVCYALLTPIPLP